ncbi:MULTISPECIES: sodium-dependent transporter [Helicobacter]|uniref:Transmembrane transport protein n=2 Tax=Helicobacter TaxID=209 RepID=A0A377J4M1_9HELI|nr:MULTISPECIES: sodium-dependent transporter [Helicobacter]MDL0079767.1 sodium-dependent transporter [Helicobacter sp. CPD2-1]MDL0082138.1 sodium-dependent transporter [Helicobacter sp. XJK30-2]STO97269.1 transmembrane transport protein [Helicobacter canis]
MNTFSKFGFILATLGSSIGLGHIWRFPYMAGQMGGGAFVLLFLVLALVIGVSLLITDMVIGNRGKKDVVGCFETLDPSPKKPWRLAGIAIIGGPLILSFYAVILGWILYYFVAISFNLPSNMFLSKWAFNELMSERIWCQVLGLFACLFITALIVSLGIKKGIEKLNLVLMPLLFIIFIGLLIYAAFQPSFMQAVHFLFDFKYEDINSNVFMEALAQMFFSLSLGVGTIITYAALTQEKQNLLTSALWVVVPGIIISLVAGLIIFTFYFGYDGSLGNDGDRGINLVFISLPLIFSEFGAVGQILCLAFLGALLFAGITSTISLLEPSVFYLTQRCGVSRAKASFWVSVVVFVLGLFAIHSFSSYHIQHLQTPLLITTDKHSIFFWLNTLIQLDNPAFFWLDYLTAKIIMPLSALASIIFLGYIIKKDTLREFTRDFLSPIAFSVWYFIIRYIAPIVILAVFIFKFFE